MAPGDIFCIIYHDGIQETRRFVMYLWLEVLQKEKLNVDEKKEYEAFLKEYYETIIKLYYPEPITNLIKKVLNR
jgi:hypothetical protein